MGTDKTKIPAKPNGSATDAADGIWAPARRLLTAGLVLAVTFVAFEALAIATVLPVVGRHLGDLRLYGWVFSAFLLSSLIGIVVAGTLADRVPIGRVMLTGLALFAVGLVIGGTAPTMAILVAGRAVQGLEGDQGHREDQANGERTPPRGPDAAGRRYRGHLRVPGRLLRTHSAHRRTSTAVDVNPVSAGTGGSARMGL